MNLQELQLECRTLLSQFVAEVTSAGAMSQADISAASELFLLELFRELYDLPGLRSLNAERKNYPGLDLGDDAAGIGFQITAERSLDKIKESLSTVIKNGLQAKFPHVKFYITTTKQGSYSQAAVDQVADGHLHFDVLKDVHDYTDLVDLLAKLELDRLEIVARILRKHIRVQDEPSRRLIGITSEAADRDLDLRYIQADQKSLFPENQSIDPFSSLGEECLLLNDVNRSSDLRRRVLLRAARSAAVRGRLDDAKKFERCGLKLTGVDSPLPARARILEADGRVKDAIQLLRDENDKTCVYTLLNILQRQQGDDRALDWLRSKAILVAELDPHAVINLSQIYIRKGRINELVELLNDITLDQFVPSPYLRYLRGILRTVATLPTGDQGVILSASIPLTVSFTRPNVADADIDRHLDGAISDLEQFLQAGRQLGLEEATTVARFFLTWCALLHSGRYTTAKAELVAALADPKRAIAQLQFAYAFLEKFDSSSLESWLDSREQFGGLNSTELRGLLVIYIHSGRHRQIADSVEKHRGRLIELLGEALVVAIEVQALANCGDAASAQIVLDTGCNLLDPGIISVLQTEISKAQGADPVAAHLHAYEDNKTTLNLKALVHALVENRNHRILGPYAELLFAETKDLRDLNIAAKAYIAAGEFEEFVRLAGKWPQLLDRDPEIKRQFAWQLVKQGRLAEAGEIAESVAEKSPGDRDLNLEIAVAIDRGHWEKLSVPLARFIERSADYDGLTLIRAAHLAIVSGFGPYRELMQAALTKPDPTAEVYLGAYTLAIEGGLEEEKNVAASWLQKALDMSGPDGPVSKFEMKDLLERQVEWQKQSRRLNDALIEGVMPLSVVTLPLNTSLAEIILENFEKNMKEAVGRNKTVVPLFSGTRSIAGTGARRRIALDVTAILVLGWLDLLKHVFGAYAETVVPAGVMRELFDGRRRLKQFQQSQLTRATQIRTLRLAKLKIVEVPPIEPDDLASQIGSDLAALIRAAQIHDGVLVRPAPVSQLGSNALVNADLSVYEAHICDMPTLLKALSSAGVIDQAQEALAGQYFSLQDTGWPSPAKPSISRPLYLDAVALAYLQTVGLLEIVVEAFDSVFVSSSVDENSRELLATEMRRQAVLRTIDSIRDAIRHADEKGRIVFGSFSDDPSATSSEKHSTMQLLADLRGSDLVVFDDRALNREPFATDRRGHSSPIATSLDLIEELQARGVITAKERQDARHRLRVAGVTLMPVDQAELSLGAQRSGGYESSEIRAIADSINLARARRVPRFPAELRWFVDFNGATKDAIKGLWKLPGDTKQAEIHSDILLTLLPNPRDWLLCWSGDPAPNWVNAVDRITASALALPVELKDPNARAKYHAWLASRLLTPMRSLDPDRYKAFVEQLKSFVRNGGSPTNG